MCTKCTIAYRVTHRDREKKGSVSFNPELLPKVNNVPEDYRLRQGLPRLQDIKYRPYDLTIVPDGLVIRTECSCDGYVRGGTGETLLKHYNTPEKALNLVLGGDADTVFQYTDSDGTERGGFRPFAMWYGLKTVHSVTRKPVPQDRLIEIEPERTTRLDGSYMYLYDEGVWYVHDGHLVEMQEAFPNDLRIRGIPFWEAVEDYLRFNIGEIVNELYSRKTT